MANLAPAEAHEEIRLMVTEKMATEMEATFILISGGSAASVFGHYRDEVAANAQRLLSDR